LNLQTQIASQANIVVNLKIAIEELADAMRQYAGKSQIIWSTLWEKSWELRNELEREQYRLQCLPANTTRPNRDQRRGALIASMCVGDRVMLD
jgi:hypothetical protein